MPFFCVLRLLRRDFCILETANLRSVIRSFFAGGADNDFAEIITGIETA